MAKICSFYDWDGLGALYNRKYLDMDKLVTGYEKVFAEAIAYITGQKPDLSFIYVGHPDEVGHDIGWGSKEYYESIEQVDKLIGDLVKALKDNGMYDETYIIVVSDHGGVKKGHGSESMAEIQVPWIIKGPNTIKNRLMEQQNDNFNTAATIAWLFGAPLPDCWIGRPALGAFSDQEKFVNENSRVYVPRPGSSFPGGSSLSPVEVILFVEEPGMEIRYTLDGSTPVKESQLYENPVKIEQTTVLKAVAFLEGNPGAILEVPFTRVKSVQKVDLKNEPGKQYQAQGHLSLFDGITASADYKDKAWLGFEGDNLNATIDLGTEKKVNYVIIRYLNNEAVWIYPPIGAGVDWSTDGKRFHKLARLKAKDIEKQNKSGINELKIDLKDVTARYLTIIIDNQGKCPKGHPGAGEKAWLFVDEIIIK